MTYIATIRRIKQCVADSQAWWSERQAGEAVLLMKEDSNAVAPEQAVAAYIDNQKCGYVRSADVPVIRAIIGDNDGIGVRLEACCSEDDCLLVGLEADEKMQLPPYQSKIVIRPIAGMSLPQLDMARELMVSGASGLFNYIESVQDIVQNDKARNDLFLYAEWMAQHYGQSLSGDEYRTAQDMIQTINQLKAEVEEFDLLDEELSAVKTSYRTLSQDCLNVWKKELKAAERVLKAKNGLVEEIKMLLTQGTVSREKLLAELTNWLQQLPHNLFQLWDTKPSLFAQRLWYERLSTRELDAVKTYLIIYAYVREWGKKGPQGDWGAILFTNKVDNYRRANIKCAMDQFLKKPYSTPELAKKIRAFVARGEMNSPLEGNFSLYCRALKAYFGCQFDDSNFRKALK